MKYRHLFFLALISFVFSSCALLFWSSENGEIKRAYAKHQQEGGLVYYSKKDVDLHKKIRMKKLAVKHGSEFSLTGFPNGQTVSGYRQAEDTTLGLSFYKITPIKGQKSNWVLWNMRKKQLTFFYTDQNKPDKFAVKPGDIGPRLATKKGNIPSKNSSVKDIDAMRLRIEAIKAEEKRISDSIAEANTLKGKEITKFEVQVDQSLGGIDGTIRINIIAHLKNGKTLKTQGIGGLTPWKDYQITSSFVPVLAAGNLAQMKLPSKYQEMQDEFELTIKSAHGNGPTHTEKVIVRYPSSLELKDDGEAGGQGSGGSGSSKTSTTGGAGGRGGNGGNGGNINIVIKPTKHKSTGEVLALVESGEGSNPNVYVLSAGASLVLSARGGAGGRGGSGGRGYCSTSFSCRGSGVDASPRYGGPGGPGGPGGTGGNGGRIRVRYEAGAPRLQITTHVEGGAAGRGGQGGDGGCDMSCQGQNYSATKSKTYPDGSAGSPGSAGRDGQARID